MLQSFPSVFETAGSCPPMCGRIQDAYSGNRTVLCPVRHHCSTCSSGHPISEIALRMADRSRSISMSCWMFSVRSSQALPNRDAIPRSVRSSCRKVATKRKQKWNHGSASVSTHEKFGQKWQQSGNKSGNKVPVHLPAFSWRRKTCPAYHSSRN